MHGNRHHLSCQRYLRRMPCRHCRGGCHGRVAGAKDTNRGMIAKRPPRTKLAPQSPSSLACVDPSRKKPQRGAEALESHGIVGCNPSRFPFLLRTVHREEYNMFCPPHRVPPERITWADPELWNGVPSAHQSVLPCGSSATSKQKMKDAHSLILATQPDLPHLHPHHVAEASPAGPSRHPRLGTSVVLTANGQRRRNS